MTSEIKVNVIKKASGSSITIGESGDTVSLATGANQTGFGRSGSVDWQTSSIKTSTFTAESGKGYFCNTTGGTFTVNLPSSPSAGDIVAVKDYANTFDTNKLTVGRGGSNIGGNALDAEISDEGISATLVYVDATKGWLVTSSGLQSEVPGPEYIAATGGTVTTVCTNYKVHTFTSPGTFTVTSTGNCAGSNTVSYMVVAGGGAGGTCRSGGGGAGGFREGRTPQCSSYTASPLNAPAGLPVSAQAYPITVGAGGTSPGNRTHHGGCGSASSFSTISSAGGGGGQSDGTPGSPGKNGGSAGGGSNSGNGGSGNTPPVSPPQGNDGGPSTGGSGGGGGGGATAAGTSGNNPAGTGGAGATTSINATPTAFAGGGGGGSSGSGAPGGTGGGGGGQGGGNPTAAGTAGTANTGGGGGGTSEPGSGGGGAGGSGIVIIRYRFQ